MYTAGLGFSDRFRTSKRWIVKYSGTRRMVCIFLTLTVLCAIVEADSRGPAPQFTAKSLDGETFTNRSLRGRAVLLQFWATWCQYCRRDQAPLDNVARTFSNELVVLAIDVGESESTVRSYLEQHPRSTRVVLNEGEALASRFGAKGFPYYVLINSEGDIAGTQSGSGGEESLRHLLSRAGLSQHSTAPTVAVADRNSGAKVIDLPRYQSSQPAKPLPKTIFIFTSGERIETDRYTFDAGSLHVWTEGKPRVIAISLLDMKATLAVNHERGIELKVPKSGSEVFLAF